MSRTPNSPLSYETPVARPGTGLAIASLICGIIGLLFFPLALVAVILGIIALAKRRSPQDPGKGMAIGGLVTGGIGLLILPLLLISILVPSLGRARTAANRIVSSSNLRQIGLALKMYANEDREMLYPPSLALLAATQDLTPEKFVAPQGQESPATPGPDGKWAPLIVPGGPNCSYLYPWKKGWNDNISSDVVLVYEPLALNENEGANFLYADGHVDWLSKSQAQSTIAQIESGVNPPK